MDWFENQFKERKMSVATFVVCMILAFSGGGTIVYLVKPQEVNNYTKVIQENNMNMYNGQISATVVGDKFTTNVQIDIKGMTNIHIYETIDGKRTDNPDFPS